MTSSAETGFGAGIVAGAVTALFVPGDRPDRFGKAAAAGADVVILDLEDAVAPANKSAALDAVLVALGPATSDSLRALVRINAVGTATFDAELEALATLGAALLGVLVPKADHPDSVSHIANRLQTVQRRRALVALVESATGVLGAVELARTPGMTRLAFGALDLTADVDADLESPVVDHARAQVVLASRAAELAAPLDSPETAIHDEQVIGAAARRARAAGFGGKLCIHPAQLAAVRAGFRPSPEEIAWARTVVDGGGSAIQVAGHMVDRPVIERALRILRRAGELGASGSGDQA